MGACFKPDFFLSLSDLNNSPEHKYIQFNIVKNKDERLLIICQSTNWLVSVVKLLLLKLDGLTLTKLQCFLPLNVRNKTIPAHSDIYLNSLVLGCSYVLSCNNSEQQQYQIKWLLMTDGTLVFWWCLCVTGKTFYL